jgi:hypothetical protein
MKTRIAPISIAAVVGLGLIAASALNLPAQIAVAPNPGTTTPPAQTAAVRLSYGVADIVKLAKAHVNEDTILAYIGTSGTVYNLGANEIIYLKEQGVSDRVLTAMLEQRNRLTVAAAQTAQAAPPSAQPVDGGAGAPQYAPAAAQPPPYGQDATAGAPASSVYVIPSAAPAYAYPDYYPSYAWGYPYYGGYYGYGYPGVSLGFGWGGGWYGSGWYGGYRGYYGGYHGGYGGYGGYHWGYGGYHGGGGGGHHH